MNELEIPDLLWFNVEEEIQRLKEIGGLKQICHLRSIQQHWEGQGDSIPFTTTGRNKFVRRVLAS